MPASAAPAVNAFRKQECSLDIAHVAYILRNPELLDSVYVKQGF